MQPTSLTPTDAAVFGCLGKPDRGDFSPEAAREILSLKFDKEDARRMNQPAEKAREGTLSLQEEAEVESYRRAGYLLGILWSKARLSLKRARAEPADGRGA